MSPTSSDKYKNENPLARIHSPAVMMLLVFLLVVYLVYVLAENFGLEGEGGWLNEVMGVGIFIAGIIFVAALAGAVLLGIRTRLRRRRSDAPWADKTDNTENYDL